MDRPQEFRKCIECFLCQDTCHVVRDHEENKAAFAGPRFLMRVAELDMHPLDAFGDTPVLHRATGLTGLLIWAAGSGLQMRSSRPRVDT